MRHIELELTVPAEDATNVFESVLRWEKYPDLAPHVNATTVRSSWPASEGESDWELHFRSGLLRWSEREEYHSEALRITFAQTDGDFDAFSGTWQLRQDGADVQVCFAADFDFGIPSLEGILDPIAERVIKETVAWAVAGLFPGASPLADDGVTALPGTGR